MLKKTLVNAALIMFGVFFALCMFDIAVYLSPKKFLPSPLLKIVQQMEMNSGSTYLNHPELEHTIKPGTDFVFAGEEFTFRLQTRLNYPDAGFRGGTLGGPVWGAAFGDSFTFGPGVDQTETWVGQLAKLTNREIINFGVPGYGPHQYTRVFQKYGKPLRPKIVFYTLFTNDLKDGQRFEARQNNELPRSKLQGIRSNRSNNRSELRAISPIDIKKSGTRKFSIKVFLKNHSASYILLRNLNHSLMTKRGDNTWGGIGVKLLERKLRSPYDVSDTEFDSAWTAIAKQIDTAIEESKGIHATFVLLYFPSKEEVYWQLAKERVKPIRGFEERINRLSKTTQSFCRVRQLLCLDLSSALRGRGINGEKLYFPIDIHWNERGHLAVAQEIVKFLRDKNLIN